MVNPTRSFFQNARVDNISGGTFQMVSESTPIDTSRKLLSRHISPNALPDSAAMYDAPKCYPETRKAINNKLQRWIWRQADLDTKLMWLHGGAGAGKSAILRTIALGDETPGSNIGTPRVLGSFFFSRTDPTRNTAQVLVPTLAFQLCKAHPVAKDIVLNNIADNYELIFTTSIRNQVHSLLVEPLSHLESQYNWVSNVDQDQGEPGRVFVIDGLDECADSKKQVEIIEAIAILVRDLPVRVLLASRPDAPISSTIRHSAALRGVFSEISLSDDPDSKADIRLFVELTLKEVRETHQPQPFDWLPDSWKEKYYISEVVKKSSSHFMYASTAMKYIVSGQERPDVALDVILGVKAPRTGMPFEELDTLYRHILGKAHFPQQVLKVLSHCVLTEFSRSVESIHLVLEYAHKDILHFLSDVSSLVTIVSDPHRGHVVQLRHASLGDCLRDKLRAKEFYVGTKRQFHREHLKRYFALFDSARIPPEQIRMKRLAVYSGESTDKYNDPLVRHIATGIAASPRSDDTTFLIRQHRLPVIYNFLRLQMVDTAWPISDGIASYMRGIHDYDVENGDILRESLKDFLEVQESIEMEYPTQDSDYIGGIIIPLLLERLELQTLVDIAYAGFHNSIHSRTLAAFTDKGTWPNVGTCRHYYPVRMLREIRNEMPGTDDNLASATLNMFVILDEVVCNDPRRDMNDRTYLFDGILVALTFVLPKLVFRNDIALYTNRRLPAAPYALLDEHPYGDEAPVNVIGRARRAMKAYSLRGDTEMGSDSDEDMGGNDENADADECDHANDDEEV
ncbi:hypothetical protein D9619_010999 [Psilocybe cf. subviscida]|uniref:Nephrocystin 3-like N-terminal domain-containing protein n=1 Tax=Psilocybe cf. subviscida TaxID=2480587 RepID=A0A8H5B994_9AGAR|nr:hypothetical protein D9619_010999 [Psilocybe cf. subviscida]